ncbi:MAG: cytochrome [Planctomycetota bacterium]|nr:cytochrome [Planctomycetota bacterium]
MTSEAIGGPKLFGPEMLADPYPVYHTLRAADPVLWVPTLDAWVVTSYEAVSAGLRDARLSSQRFDRIRGRAESKLPGTTVDPSMRSMIHMDPPDHSRLRSLVVKAFTPRVVDAMEGRIQGMIDGFLSGITCPGRMDVMDVLAYPLPVTVIAEMLGVSPEDRHRFKTWSDEISVILSGDVAGLPEAEVKRAFDARHELVDYFRSVVARNRGGPGTDLLTALARAEDEGGRLSEDELYSTAVLLLIAGNETTTNLIGNGLLALLSHPDQLERLKGDPTLVTSAVEEMLRYDSPVQMTTRMAKVDLEIHGTAIKQGQWVFLMIAAANRDPARFPDPDRFDITRADNEQIAFGAGPHFCLGASLARLEGQLAIRSLLSRFPDLKLGTGAIEHRNNFNLRGLKSLDVVV